LRRFIIIGAMAAVLVGTAAAYAATALNHYTAKITFSSSKPGTPAKPVPLNYVETLTAANVTAGKVAAPLIDIKTTIYGMVANLKPFKTCTFAKILTGPKFNTNCPKGSEVATGQVNSFLGASTLAQATAARSGSSSLRSARNAARCARARRIRIPAPSSNRARTS
jgi:hypothetical protein